MSNEETDGADTETAEDVSPGKTPMDPVRKWTLIVIGICVVLMAWYLVSDRHTPYSSQARVHALVVPIASQVSANLLAPDF